MSNGQADEVFVFKSFVNSFHYLYRDAELLREQAENNAGFSRTQLSRTALLLYVLSLEGLINRAMDHFVPDKLHDFVIEREARFSFQDKWILLPLAASQDPNKCFDVAAYPWSHFAELVRLRNDYVHPKHDRPAYYRAITQTEFDPLDPDGIPDGSGIREKDLIYRQTGIPKDPYAVLPEHAAIAKRIVDDMVEKLDDFLDARLSTGDWYRSDQMTLMHPPDATLADVPRAAEPPQ